MEIWAADGGNEEIDHVRIRQTFLGAVLCEMAAKLKGVVEELQADARFADKAQDEGQESGDLECFDVLCGGSLWFVDG